LVKKDTFVTVSKNTFYYEKKTIRDILGVGVPASFEFS
jgi:hypothetical protein